MLIYLPKISIQLLNIGQNLTKLTKLKRIYITALNDLVTDNRVHKVACTLLESGSKVTVVGIQKKHSLTIENRPYQTKRFRLFFKNGPAFYLEFNIRVLLYLLLRKFDYIVSNDLDTLLGSFYASKLRLKTLVYDSHEYFTELPELVNREFPKKIWKLLESKILPKLKYTYTVSESIAKTYKKQYGIEMKVVRNVPYKISTGLKDESIKNGTKQILYQGSLNIGRGLEHMIDAMEFLDDTKLHIIGDGDITEDLKERIIKKGVADKVELMGRIPFDELPSITNKADLGIALEENIGLNYYYALPNKLFDYIQARIPVLVSPFPEMQKIVNKYEIGTVYDHKTPEALAEKIIEVFKLKNRYNKWKKNTSKAAEELCWENEKIILKEVYNNAGLIFN